MENGMQGILMLLHFFVFFAVRNSLNFNFGIIHGIYDFVFVEFRAGSQV